MTAEFQIDGLKELSKKLNALDAKTAAKALRAVVMSAAVPIVRDAKLRIPVGSEAHRTYKGNLVSPGFAQRSIARSSRIQDGKAVVDIGVKREAFYATQFVELGTQNMRAQAWLVPALEAKQSESIARMKRMLQRRIAKLTK